MNRTLVIGDIHGCIRTFRELLYNILHIDKGDRIILLGDLIDRGPDSKSVIDEIINLKNDKYDITALRGNHEQMLIDTSIIKDNFALWKRNGGARTIESFNISHINELDKSYLEFFKSMPHFIELDDFVLVHAGLNFEIENPLEDKTSMMWVRNNSIEKEKIKGKRLIVGHTPQSIEDIIVGLNSEIIKLDAGCVYYGFKKNLGYLAALDLETMKLQYSINIDYQN